MELICWNVNWRWLRKRRRITTTTITTVAAISIAMTTSRGTEMDMMITELEYPVEIYDVMLLLIDNVNVKSSPASGVCLGH